jgi:hypothetical protein
MQNDNKTNDGWEEESLSVIHREHAVVILLAPEASDKAYQLINELKLVGIGVRMESENLDVGKQTAAEFGTGDDNAYGSSHICDREDLSACRFYIIKSGVKLR